MVKRLFDIVACCILGIPAIILFLVAAFLLKREESGPVLFKQIRIGRGERLFTLYKVRTMSVGTANVASHQVDIDRITKAGRLLRKTKLDEIPQLWNVLRGEMSLVGPRPCLPNQTELVEERRLRGVFTMRPGITGLAQIRNIDMSTPELLARTDAEYGRNRSIRNDLSILFATVAGKGSGDAAKANYP